MCSYNILKPIRKRITPPIISGLRRFTIDLPHITPRMLPNIDITNEHTPMTISGKVSCSIFLYPRHAKDMPTARASILVATAKSSWLVSFEGSKCDSSSLPNESFIIFPPRKAKRPNAIQWSTDSR